MRKSVRKMKALAEAAKRLKPSPLMTLCSELRNKIYHLVLVTEDPIDLSNKATVAQKALLNTCTTIRIEASAMFWGANKFVVDPNGRLADIERLHHILSYAGPTHCQMITNLTVRIRGHFGKRNRSDEDEKAKEKSVQDFYPKVSSLGRVLAVNQVPVEAVTPETTWTVDEDDPAQQTSVSAANRDIHACLVKAVFRTGAREALTATSTTGSLIIRGKLPSG
jgi:hypothetical protein